MKISREYIVAIVVLVIVLGVLGGMYQFYYKVRLEEFQKNVKRLQALDSAITTMETTFNGFVPDLVIKRAIEDVQPLSDELARRATFFTTGDVLNTEEVPVGKMLRFFYEEQFNKLFDELRQLVANHIPPCYYDVETNTFGAPRPEELAGMELKEAQIKRWLRLIKIGTFAIKTLMDAKATYIMEVVVWPPRTEYEMLSMRSVGVNFGMAYGDFVNLIDDLRLKDQYFSINALSLCNPYMRWQPEPPMQIKMILSIANFIETRKAVAAAPAAIGAIPTGAAAPGNVPAQMLAQQGINRRAQQQPMTKWQEWKRWLKKYFWPFVVMSNYADIENCVTS
jgi:hypothetical protein